VVDDRATFILIGNTQRYGGGLIRPFKGAMPDDGMLDVCCFHGSRAVDLVRYMVAACVRRLWALSDVTGYTGKEIRIGSRERVLVQLDGDPGGELPLTFKISPNAVAFCVS
jgi:diacylglycerol kinase family enzyme